MTLDMKTKQSSEKSVIIHHSERCYTPRRRSSWKCKLV